MALTTFVDTRPPAFTPEPISRGGRRIGAANETSGGRSALDVMPVGELTDMMRVRRPLDAERGCR